MLYFNANKPLFFFFGRIPVVLENRRSSQGGGAHPLHPPPRSASETGVDLRLMLVLLFRATDLVIQYSILEFSV